MSLLAPVTPLLPPSGHTVSDAIRVLEGRRFAVLTGAGMSTDSGIPDYRGEGAPKNHPMSFQEFLTSPERRRRYWMGAHLGWQRFQGARPNEGHLALAELEHSGWAAGVITQNVDGLHHDAGSNRVVDLHGRLDRVRCLECGQSFSRQAIERELAALNPDFAERIDPRLIRPDGDVELDDTSQFVPPQCDICQGALKPEVVFFGEFVPPTVFAQAKAMVESAEALVVAGSSLVVNTGMRLVTLAKKRRHPIVVINRGPTKADRVASVRIEGVTS